MFQPSSRRFVTVLSLAAALFLLPMAESQAAQRRPRRESDFLDRIEVQAQSFWHAVLGVFQNVGLRWDDNG